MKRDGDTTTTRQDSTSQPALIGSQADGVGSGSDGGGSINVISTSSQSRVPMRG